MFQSVAEAGLASIAFWSDGLGLRELRRRRTSEAASPVAASSLDGIDVERGGVGGRGILGFLSFRRTSPSVVQTAISFGDRREASASSRSASLNMPFLAVHAPEVLVVDGTLRGEAHGLDQLLDRAVELARSREEDPEVVAGLGVTAGSISIARP